MIDGDDPECHDQAAELLLEADHVGQPHEVQRAVRSVRGNGDAYLFVLCNCGGELGFKLSDGAAPVEVPPIALAPSWDDPALDPDDVPSAGDL